MSSSVPDRDATPVEPAGPVADTDPPADVGGGRIPPSAPSPGSASDSDAPDVAAELEGAEEEAATEEEDVATDDLATEIAAEIVELAAERDQYRDMAQRVQADFENYRKRVQAQVRDEADRASGRLAEALLPVLDAAEAAYLGHPDEVGPLLNLMLGELRKHGLETLDLQDQPFDPNLAEAVAHEPGDGGAVVVADVLRSGYRWNGRTLRPAMVRTADRTLAPGADAPAGDER